jgi:RNA polymerase-binding transcription factor DksA
MSPTTKAAAKATKAPAKSATKASKAATAKKSAKSGATKVAAKKTAPAKKSAPAKKAAPAKKVPAKAPASKAPAASKARAASKAPAATKAPAKAAPAKKLPPARTLNSRIPALAKRSEFDGTKKAPPKRKGPLDKFLLGQLESLQSERITYTHQAVSLKAEADLLAAEREPGDVQFDEESGEGDTLAVERERDLALSAQASAAVEEIDRSIAKLHDGTYGVCEQCYANIPRERLRALPYAALCVQCKSAGFARR